MFIYSFINSAIYLFLHLFFHGLGYWQGFPGGTVVKNLPTMWKIRVQSLGQEDPLEKGMATHSSILAWKMPWAEELAAAAAKSLQSCPTLCDPIDGSPSGFPSRDSPGKNTGVSCHFLLQCMKVKKWKWSRSVVSNSSDPMDCSLPPSMGFSRQKYWSGVPLPSPKINSCY